MKYIELIAVFCITLLSACTNNSNNTDAIKEFIPGTYVKDVKNRFLIASDTLIIQNTAGNNYLIVNRTGYQRIKGGRLTTPQYLEVNLKAHLNEGANNLYEERLGKTFSFDPQNKRLFEGASEYRKVIP